MSARFFQTSFQAFIPPLDETTAEPAVKLIRDEFCTRIGKRTV